MYLLLKFYHLLSVFHALSQSIFTFRALLIFLCIYRISLCVRVCERERERERACLSLSLSISISLAPLMSLSAHHSQIRFNNRWLLGINVNAELHRILCSENDILWLTSQYLERDSRSSLLPKKTNKKLRAYNFFSKLSS